MPRYAAYFRTSSDQQEARATVQTQLADARAYEQAHGVKIAHRYLDDGVSSRVPFAARPEGARCLRDARAGLFTHVVVQDFTRVGFALDMLKVAEELEAGGVKIVSIMEPLPGGGDASVATLLRTMLAGFGQYRIDTIRHKSVAGQERCAGEGRWNGGVPPFGYRVENHRLAPDEERAAVVREIFRMYVEEGYRLRQLTAALNARGVTPPRAWHDPRKSRRWHVGTVSKILRNPVYVGRATWRKTHTVRDDSGGASRPPSDPSSRVPISVPPIIEEKLFGQAERRLKANLNESKRNAKHYDYILKSLLRCGVCEIAYVGYGSGDGESFYYRCNSRYVREEKCANRYVNAPRAEAEVWEWCFARLNDPRAVKAEMRRRLRARLDSRPRIEREAARLAGRVAAKATERARVIGLVRRGAVTEEEGAHELDEIAAEVEQLGVERSRLLARLTEAEEVEARVASLDAVLCELRLKAGRPECRREVLLEMIERVVVEPDASERRGYRLVVHGKF